MGKKVKRILVVDDEELNRDLLTDMLESFGHESEIAIDGIETLSKVKLDIDLVLLDVMMPGMDGFEVVQRIREDSDVRDIPIVMVTALTAKEDRLRAVKVGANDFIAKSVDRNELRLRTASLLKMKEAQDENKIYQKGLEEKVEKRTKELRKSLEESVNAHRETEAAYVDTINRLSIAAEYKDEDTALHINRMSRYSALIAKSLHLPSTEVEIIQLASPMHDIGKIGTPDAVLLKPGKHTPVEWEIMKQHATIGGKILSGAASKLLQAGEIIAMSHHEKWDGSGYPNGLSGEDIHLSGRITAVADVFDALTSKRPYKEVFSNEKSLGIMKEGRGKHFEPRLVDLFLEHLNEVFAIQEKYRDE